MRIATKKEDKLTNIFKQKTSNNFIRNTPVPPSKME